MAEFDPQALLSKPIDDVKPPVQLPLGSYLGVVVKREFDKAKNKDETPIVRFEIGFREALPDVDADELSAALDGEPLTEKTQRLEFWLTPNALFRLKEFGMDHCKVQSPGDTMAELIEAIVGCEAVFMLGQQPNKKNPERPYVNIVSTAPVPE